MKSLKKILSIFAAFMMVVGLTMTNASAAENGTITITDGKEGSEYNAYKLFDATSTTDGKNSAYTISAADYNTYWMDGENPKTFEGTNPFEFTLTPSGNYSVSTTASPSTVAKFLRDNISALGYTVAGTATIAPEATTGTITGLEPGYYYVTSTTGSMVMITTATPNAEIVDKNTTDFDKTATGETADKVVDKKVGDEVNFTITFKLNKGMTNVVVTDTMTSGLTFKQDSLQSNDEYTVSYNNQTMTVTFKQTYLDTIEEETTVTLNYTATVNENASYNEKDTNNATLTENNGPSIGSDYVNVKTAGFAISKVNGENNPLAGATFKVYADADHKEEVKFVEKSTNQYTQSATGTITEVTTTDTGRIEFGGLEPGKTYYLVETKAPDGYNLLDKHIEITAEYHVENVQLTATPIINQTGTVLPSTGGMGTTMIYIAGAILMVGAAIIFVTNKRMKHE